MTRQYYCIPPSLSSLTLFIPLKKFKVTMIIVSDFVLFMYIPANALSKCWLTYQPGIGGHVVQLSTTNWLTLGQYVGQNQLT